MTPSSRTKFEESMCIQISPRLVKECCDEFDRLSGHKKVSVAVDEYWRLSAIYAYLFHLHFDKNRGDSKEMDEILDDMFYYLDDQFVLLGGHKFNPLVEN